MGEKFEVGNTVYAEGRVTTVEKVYANGNFKLAGIAGQWRQWGGKAGDHGYRSPRCEHYTEATAAKVARSKAVSRLNNVTQDMGRLWLDPKHLSAEEINAITAGLAAFHAKLFPAESGLGDRASTRDAMSAPDEQKPRASDGGGS